MKLSEILKDVNVPKSQFNKFGNFHYSTRDDMLSVIKPLLSAIIPKTKESRQKIEEATLKPLLNTIRSKRI